MPIEERVDYRKNLNPRFHTPQIQDKRFPPIFPRKIFSNTYNTNHQIESIPHNQQVTTSYEDIKFRN